MRKSFTTLAAKLLPKTSVFILLFAGAVYAPKAIAQCKTVAKAKNVLVNLGPSGTFTIQPKDVDNGSYTSCGGGLTYSLNKAEFSCADHLTSSHRFAYQAASKVGNEGYAGELGMAFTVKQAIVISQLGAFDHMKLQVQKSRNKCSSPQYYKSLIKIPLPKTCCFVFGGLFPDFIAGTPKITVQIGSLIFSAPRSILKFWLSFLLLLG